LTEINFNLDHAVSLLKRTPGILSTLLEGLPEEWIYHNEGPKTWSPFDVLGHLIHGEKTDWIPRIRIILHESSDKTFEPFDRFAQFKESENKSLSSLLKEFETLRIKNIETLDSFNLSNDDLERWGTHPELGKVKLSELIATWTAHDLGHLYQISRVMANQYRNQVGPWKKYLGIIKY